MARELFGTDGMRGKAGQYPLDKETIRKTGQAIGVQFAQNGKAFLVGHDPRESSDWIVEALVAGLKSSGAAVKLVGVIPTPGLAYLTRQTDSSAGVMVTASHNGYVDNGIKVFKADGLKLTDEEESHLNQLIKSDHIEASAAGSEEQASELADEYRKFLVESAGGVDFSEMKIAIDCANGAAYQIAPEVFRALGAEVTAIYDKPDGKNINYYCGATNPNAVKAEVMKQKLDLGIALDGDADRLIMIDSQGREFNGDNILYTLAIQRDVPAVVTTVMSNYGLETALAGEGIKLKRTQVGDRYVLDELHKNGLVLGGEQSGHIIINDIQPTGDGILAAIQVLCEIKKSGKSLDRWHDEVETLPQAIYNLRVKDKAKIEDPSVQELIKRQAAVLEGTGRLLVRASGTEPKIRVMVEGPNAEAVAESIAAEIGSALAKL